MNDLALFSFEEITVRSITIDGEPWFVAKDVIEGVGSVWKRAASIQHVPEQWRGAHPISSPSGTQEMAVLSEHGVYFYLARSDKPKALPIQMWLAGEVLPAIRKTGSYAIAAKSPGEIIIAMGEALVAQERRMTALEAEVAQTKQIAQTAEAKAQATAMACQDYSIMAWSRLHAIPIDLTTAQKLGQKAAAISREQGLPIGNARDPRFGKVNTYIETVVAEVFDSYIEELKL